MKSVPKCPCCGADLEPAQSGRIGDYFCGICMITVSREAIEIGGEMLFPCEIHEPVPDAERATTAEPAGLILSNVEGDLSQFFDQGGPSRPHQLVAQFVERVRSGDSFRLEDFVMPPYEAWDLREVADGLAGHGIGSHTRYPVPGWAEIVLIRAIEPIVFTGPTVVTGMSAYVKFIEDLNDWRIYRIGPHVDPSTLPD